MSYKLISAGVRAAGALLLGGVILWQVAERSVPPGGETVIHVTEAEVDVFLDDSHYRVDTQVDSPIVRELAPGWHTLRMMKDGEVLYDRPFEIVRGEYGPILTAWNELRQNSPPDRFRGVGPTPDELVQAH
ncbi:hypothetical protein EP7_000628 [Isosphaeraceae bacterium EP7]